MKPLETQAYQYHFERKPPYQEEAIMRAIGKEVNVEYNLKKVENKVKKVCEKDEVTKAYSATNKEAKMDSSGPLPPEAVLDKVSKLKEVIPNLEYMTYQEKLNLVADILNGKHDNLIFNNINIK